MKKQGKILDQIETEDLKGLAINDFVPPKSLKKIIYNGLNDDDLYEYSQRVGAFYISLVKSAMEEERQEGELYAMFPAEIKERLRGFIHSIERIKDLQRLRLSLKNIKAKGLLLEIIKEKGLSEGLVDDDVKYELGELNSGIFAVFIDDDIYFKIYKHKIPVAETRNKGVSFVALPRVYKNSKIVESLPENDLLREFHYLIWFFLMNAGSVYSNEHNNAMQYYFLCIQKEIILKLFPGEELGSYFSVSLADKKTLKNDAVQFDSEHEKKFNNHVLDLNLIICDEILPMVKAVGDNKQNLIYAVLEAYNFEELKQNFRKYKTLLEKKLVERKINENAKEGRSWQI